jgi:hypothetical protein
VVHKFWLGGQTWYAADNTANSMIKSWGQQQQHRLGVWAVCCIEMDCLQVGMGSWAHQLGMLA